MPDGLSVLGFAPTIQIIGGTISKIFNRPYAMFTEGDEHLRRCAWNILEPVFNAKVPSPVSYTHLTLPTILLV